MLVADFVEESWTST